MWNKPSHSRYIPYIGIYPLLLAFLAGVLAGCNFTPNTFLTGWDTLHPEFNFRLAFSRMLTGVWRADQGLGAVAIQSHMADLPRVILLWAMSWVMPINVLRYTTFFAALFIGPLGVYTLTKHLLEHRTKRPSTAAFIASLFYLFNLATVQHFAVPLEMFAVHYALIPWLFYFALRILTNGNRRDAWVFAVITLLAAPQAQTATLFYAYAGMLTIVVGWASLIGKNKIALLKRAGVIFFLTIGVNAFWLLPNVYAVLTQGTHVQSAKVNELFTQEAFLKNQKFGTWQDAAILKNFLFDWGFVNPNTLSQTPVLDIWNTRLNSPVMQGYLWSIVIFTLIGASVALMKKDKKMIVLLPLLLIPYAILANGQWPMKDIFVFIQSHLPVLAEALRLPFTKFSILFLLGEMVFAAIGVATVLDALPNIIVVLIFSTILTIVPIISFQPFFTGYLIQPAMRISIPTYYFDMFRWFDTQSPNARIAILPAADFWNWVNYRWGYQGAGFLQYGLPQPILDRDYDRWSTYNENYYWELSYALYSNNPALLTAVFDKYDVSYILYDTSVINRNNARSLLLAEIPELLAQIPSFQPTKTFGTVTIYQRQQIPSPIRLTQNLPTVFPAYSWTDNDVAYAQLGSYITQTTTGSPSDIIYPYRSLFTKREAQTYQFHIAESDQAISFTSITPHADTSQVIIQKSIDTATILTPGDEQNHLFATCGAPEGTLAQEKVSETAITLTSINNQGCLTYITPSLVHSQGYLVSVTSRHISGQPMNFVIQNDTAKHTEIKTDLPTKPEWTTSYFVLPPLAIDGLGYTVYLTNNSIGNIETINSIGTITFYKLPYQNMVNMYSGMMPTSIANNKYVTGISKSIPSLYSFVLPKNTDTMNTTFILSQAYNPGWVAIDLSQGRLLQHVLVNNWENGWTVDTNSEKIIVLYFAPQLLEYLGFLFLPISIWFVLRKSNI